MMSPEILSHFDALFAEISEPKLSSTMVVLIWISVLPIMVLLLLSLEGGLAERVKKRGRGFLIAMRGGMAACALLLATFIGLPILHLSQQPSKAEIEARIADAHCAPVLDAVREGTVSTLTESGVETVERLCGRTELLAAINAAPGQVSVLGRDVAMVD